MIPNKHIRLRVAFDFNLVNLFAVLVIIEVLLLLVDVVVSCCGLVTHGKLRSLLDITLEANIPTWFSSTQALMTGLVAMAAGRMRQLSDDKKRALGWYMIGLFFVYLGIDDAAQIHERVATFMNDVVKSGSGGGLVSGAVEMFPSYYWQLFFLPVFVIAGILMMVFLYQELVRNGGLVVFIGGMVCYAIAVGLDYIDGIPGNYYRMMEYVTMSFDELVHIFRSIEEFLEMLGTTFFMMSFLLVLAPSGDSKE